MAKLPPYAVRLIDLPAHRTFEVPGQLVAEWLKGLPMRDALGAPADDANAGYGKADLELYADGAHVFAVGTFHGHLHVACSRCVAEARLEIDDKVRVTFLPKHELPDQEEPASADDEGVEVNEDDLDVFPYEDDHVDLEPLFREEFVLAIPYAPLCREDCKGLCPQCGTDLNSGTCSCEAPIDPRLAALKGLKIPS